MKVPTVLVSGGAGFVGSALCRFLVSNALARVVNVDALTYAATLSSLKCIESSALYSFEKANVCDAEAMQRIFEKYQPDGVLHLAAESHVDRSISGSQVFIQTNIVGTSVLLDSAMKHWRSLPRKRARAFRFLHVSTDEVYGSLGGTGLFKETTSYDPSSPYSASKAAADHLVIAWYRTYGLPVIISNCSNNYGPFQFPEKLIPLMVLNALRSRDLTLFGDGSNVRDWLHVEDHVKALWTIFQRGRVGERYNVGGGSERSNQQVVEKICDVLDELRPVQQEYRAQIVYVEDRPGHDARYAIDASKVQSELGWEANETFESGIRSTVQWYIDNKQWWEPILEGTYSGERLGLE